MTRINTNVSSLVAQKTLARSNDQLNQALTRLSTGLRINEGKDDPAGLIASEALRSDIISVEKAITNSERANQLIATADSALGQVSSLLNDIRGLVSEAANTGALSSGQVAANQLQIDSSLEAIDRIGQITSFQGKKLLDGNLDFITTGVDSASLTGLQIDQANFGTQSQIGVTVNVVAAATSGQLNFGASSVTSDVVLQVGGANGTEAFNFASGSSIEEISTAVNLVSDATGITAKVNQDVAAADQKGVVTLSSFGLNNDIILTADAAGEDVGALNVKFITGAAGATLSSNYTAPSGTNGGELDITLATSSYVAATKSGITNAAGGGGGDLLQVTADQLGDDFNGVTVKITSVTAGADTATYNHATKEISVALRATNKNVVDATAAINATDGTGLGHLFTAVGAGNTDVLTVETLTGTLASGVDGGVVTSTASQVLGEINSAAGANFTATLATGNDGTTIGAVFEEYALTGSIADSNRLQFLGGENARNLEFVASGNNTSLSIDLTTKAPSTERASAVVGKGTVANGSFQIEANTGTALFNDTTLVIVDVASNAENVVYDEETNTLTLSVNLDTQTAQGAIDLINNDGYASTYFTATAVDGDATGVLPTSIATGEPAFTGAAVDGGTFIVNLATDASGNVTTTAKQLVDFFDTNAANAALISAGISASLAEGVDGSGLVATGTKSFGTNGQTVTDSKATDTTRALNGVNAQVVVTAVTAGADFDGVKVVFADTATAGSETFAYNSTSKTLTIGVQSGTSTATQVAAAFVGSGLEGTFTVAAGGTGGSAVTATDSGLLAGGTTTTGTVDGAAVLSNLDEGDAISAKVLQFNASSFGSAGFVSIKALSGAFSTTDSTGATKDRSVGTDVNARINGIRAVGEGLKASLNTSSLDLSFSFTSAVATGSSLTFNITGGGALFQLGPDVVSNQQARLGIQSVATASLGGVNGRLFELRSGGAKALNTDAGGAASVVDEVISSVTQLRGRLGAFQKTSLETNIFALSDTLANLVDAESSIRDADFAAESAKLTRAQILVQSGTSVLSIANSNPQNVLALLR